MKLFNTVVVTVPSFIEGEKEQVIGIMGSKKPRARPIVITAYDMIKAEYVFDVVNANFPVVLRTGMGGGSLRDTAVFEVIPRSFDQFKVARLNPVKDTMNEAKIELPAGVADLFKTGALQGAFEMYQSKGREVKSTPLFAQMYATMNSGKLMGRNPIQFYEILCSYSDLVEQGVDVASAVSVASSDKSAAQVANISNVRNIYEVLTPEFGNIIYSRNRELFENTIIDKDVFDELWERVIIAHKNLIDDIKNFKSINPFIRDVEPSSSLNKSTPALLYHQAYDVYMRSVGWSPKTSESVISRDSLVGNYNYNIEFDENGKFDPRISLDKHKAVPISFVPYSDVLKYYFEVTGEMTSTELDYGSESDGIIQPEIDTSSEESNTTSLFSSDSKPQEFRGAGFTKMNGSTVISGGTIGTKEVSKESDENMDLEPGQLDSRRLNLKTPRVMTKEITVETLFDSIGYSVTQTDGVDLIVPTNENFPSVAKVCKFWNSYNELIESEGISISEAEKRKEILVATRGSRQNDVKIGLFPVEQFWYDQWQDIATSCIMFENDELSLKDAKLIINGTHKQSLAIKTLFKSLIRRVLILTRMHTGMVFAPYVDASKDDDYDSASDDNESAIVRYCFYKYNSSNNTYSKCGVPPALMIDRSSSFGNFRDLFELFSRFMDTYVADSYGYLEAFVKLCRQGGDKTVCLVMRNGVGKTHMCLNLERSAVTQFASDMGDLIEFPSKNISHVCQMGATLNKSHLESLANYLHISDLQYSKDFPIIFGVQTEYQNNESYSRVSFVDILTLVDMLKSKDRNGNFIYQLQGVRFNGSKFELDTSLPQEDLDEIQSSWNDVMHVDAAGQNMSWGNIPLSKVSNPTFNRSSVDTMEGNTLVTTEFSCQEPYATMSIFKEKLIQEFPERIGEIKQQSTASALNVLLNNFNVFAAEKQLVDFETHGKVMVGTNRSANTPIFLLALKCAASFVEFCDFAIRSGLNFETLDMIELLNCAVAFKNKHVPLSRNDQMFACIDNAQAIYGIKTLNAEGTKYLTVGFFTETEIDGQLHYVLILRKDETPEAAEAFEKVLRRMNSGECASKGLLLSQFYRSRILKIIEFCKNADVIGTTLFMTSYEKGRTTLAGFLGQCRNDAHRFPDQYKDVPRVWEK